MNAKYSSQEKYKLKQSKMRNITFQKKQTLTRFTFVVGKNSTLTVGRATLINDYN